MKKQTEMSLILFCLISLSSPSVPFAQAWKPYDFKGTEHFKYDIHSTKNGKEEAGYLILDIEKKGEDKYKISYESKLGDSEASSSTTSSADNLAGKLMMSMMMSGSEAGTVLGSTLFTQAMPMMFMGMTDFEVGSGWSRTENGKKLSFKVESKEKVAGLEGYKCVYREDGMVKYLQVIAPDVPLPLQTEMTDEDGSQYKAKLVEYRR
jgi:hypothetical protein